MPNIVDLFYDVTHYSTTSGDSDYFSTQSVRENYGPFGQKQLENALAATLSLTWSASTVSTGDPVKDQIIAEFAGFAADQKADAWHIDPETGLRVNRHWETAWNIFNRNFGVLDIRGVYRAPGDASKAATGLYRANASNDVVDESDV